MNHPAPAAVALLAAVVYAYRDTFGWIGQGWRENPYYSHGPLVPLLAGWLIWRQRGLLTARPWAPWWPGGGVVGLAAAVYLAGRLTDINLLLGVSLVLLLHGLALTAGGPENYRPLRFPLWFLLFAVPFSQLIIHHYSFPLQLTSARLAVGVMNLLTGAGATVRGTVMEMDRQEYLVAVECSGFKALLGLLMVGLLVARLTDTSPGRRALIVLLSAPIAIASNVIRLVLILLVGRLWSHEFAVTTFHDWSGGLMLLVAIALLLAAARAVVGPEADLAGAEAAEVTGGSWRPPAGPLWATAAGVLVVGLVGLTVAPPAPPPPEVDLTGVPLTLDGWRGEELPIDERVAQELGDVAIIQRVYRRGETEPPIHVIVICGRGRRSLHPPDACYKGAGHDVLETALAEVEGLRCQRLVVGTGGRPAMLALYTFTDGETTTPDYGQHQAEALGGRTIWTQLHFATPWLGSVAATEARLRPFIALAWPAIRHALPRPEAVDR